MKDYAKAKKAPRKVYALWTERYMGRTVSRNIELDWEEGLEGPAPDDTLRHEMERILRNTFRVVEIVSITVN